MGTLSMSELLHHPVATEGYVYIQEWPERFMCTHESLRQSYAVRIVEDYVYIGVNNGAAAYRIVESDPYYVFLQLAEYSWFDPATLIGAYSVD